MTRQWVAAAAACVAASGLLAACSGGGSDDEPKASATKTTSAAPATTAAAPAPSPAAQPQGANGVTYEIQNWDDYASDPAVLAWKQTQEAIAASTNSGQVSPAMRTGLSKKSLRAYVSSLQQAWDGDWHVESVGKVKIESAATTADASTVVACLWTPTTAFLDKSGDSPDGDTAEELKVWSKQTAKLAVRDGRWVITTFAYDGECSGGAPS